MRSLFVVSVALFTRAWIEIWVMKTIMNFHSVALFTRAWIEMLNVNSKEKRAKVALFTRAWIEIQKWCNI